MPKNYYLVLGITSNATLEDIKEAYRRLVKEYHPDHYGENHSPFLNIQEAYSVLADPVQRRKHDHLVQQQKKNLGPSGQYHRQRACFTGYVEPLIPERESVDLGSASLTTSFHAYRPSFDQLYDKIFSNFRPTTKLKNKPVENLNAVITLTPEKAFRGGHVKIVIPARPMCPSCSGRGWVGMYECWRCGGEGLLSGEYPVMIHYPPGILDNHIVKMPLDRYGIGNLYLSVHFRISEML